MIILSGLGLNYKTTICNTIRERYPDVKISYSESTLYKYMNDIIGAPNYYYVDKVREEYLRAVFMKPDIMDRGPEDALVFELLKADGEIPNIWDYAWTYIYEKRNEYVQLINTLKAKRYFLYNDNIHNVASIFDNLRNNDPTNRLVIYKDEQQFFSTQDKFFKKYKELFPDHELVKFKDSDINADIDKFIDIISKSWSE